MAAERIIWLGQTAPPPAMRDNVNPGWTAAPKTQIYFNQQLLSSGAAPLQIAPGSYLLIAPRLTTHIGAQGDYNTPAGTNPKQWGVPSKQVISFGNSIAAARITHLAQCPTPAGRRTCRA